MIDCIVWVSLGFVLGMLVGKFIRFPKKPPTEPATVVCVLMAKGHQVSRMSFRSPTGVPPETLMKRHGNVSHKYVRTTQDEQGSWIFEAQQ